MMCYYITNNNDKCWKLNPWSKKCNDERYNHIVNYSMKYHIIQRECFFMNKKKIRNELIIKLNFDTQYYNTLDNLLIVFIIVIYIICVGYDKQFYSKLIEFFEQLWIYSFVFWQIENISWRKLFFDWNVFWRIEMKVVIYFASFLLLYFFTLFFRFIDIGTNQFHNRWEMYMQTM